MRKKLVSYFTGIIICIVLGMIHFSSQSCKKGQLSTDRSDSLGISASDGSPSWSPDGKKIVFVSNRDGNYEIYTMSVDGSGQTKLTENRSGIWTPSWSPGATRFAFVSNRDGNMEIYVMNADGSGQTRLTHDPGRDSQPCWSPDGQKIAFSSNRDRNWDVYIMNADGSEQTRLSDSPTFEGIPSWSPDGRKIAFVSNRDRNFDIYIMNADGSDQTRLTDNPARDRFPSWSPDGSRIAFVSERDGNRDIYVMNADGSNQTNLTNSQSNESFPSWSPDSLQIAFETDRDFDREIYIMYADGSNPVRLTNNAPKNAAVGRAPLPQSELDLDKIPYKVVFESYRETDGRENWEICLTNADGSDFVNLTNTPDVDEIYPHASPDGQRVCFAADEGEDRESKSRNVYYMNIDGSERVKIAENAYQPCWSPDGRYIAYLPGEFPRYNRHSGANKGLEIYDLETREVKRHPNEELLHLRNLCWSPDGEWFVSWSSSPNIAFKANDKTLMNLLANGCRPDISPDGKRIVWHGTDWNINIGKLDLNSPQRNITDHRIVVACEHEYWIYHADWSPDGNFLVFSYAPIDGSEGVSYPAPGSNICICDLSTGKWTQITSDGKHNKEPDWVPIAESK